MIQHSAAYQQLLAAIEADPDDALPKLVMADFLDDHGEPDLAYAYRWCANEGKWPEFDRRRRDWDWWYEEARNERSNLKGGIFNQILGLAIYHSAHDAIADLARVLKMQGVNATETVLAGAA